MHVENFLSQIATFPQFYVYLNVIQAKQMISLLLLNNFFSVISYQQVQKKKKVTNYCIRFGHSLWSANQLQRKRLSTFLKYSFKCNFKYSFTFLKYCLENWN